MAVVRYQEIVESNGEYIFLDHIIRLTICRAFVNHQNRKFVTAEKLLELAERMIKRVKTSDENLCKILVSNMPTVEDIHTRQEAPIIPIDILEQKLYFKFGLLNIMLGKENEAQ